MSKTHIAALAHIAFANRQKHRCISNIAVLSKSNIEIIIVED